MEKIFETGDSFIIQGKEIVENELETIGGFEIEGREKPKLIPDQNDGFDIIQNSLKHEYEKEDGDEIMIEYLNESFEFEKNDEFNIDGTKIQKNKEIDEGEQIEITGKNEEPEIETVEGFDIDAKEKYYSANDGEIIEIKGVNLPWTKCKMDSEIIKFPVKDRYKKIDNGDSLEIVYKAPSKLIDNGDKVEIIYEKPKFIYEEGEPISLQMKKNSEYEIVNEINEKIGKEKRLRAIPKKYFEIGEQMIIEGKKNIKNKTKK